MEASASRSITYTVRLQADAHNQSIFPHLGWHVSVYMAMQLCASEVIGVPRGTFLKARPARDQMV